MGRRFRTSILAGALSLSALLGCDARELKPEIVPDDTRGYRLNDDAKEYLRQEEGLSSARISTIPWQILQMGRRASFPEWARAYATALEACGTNERLLQYEYFTLEGRKVLCKSPVPPEYARAFAESGVLGAKDPFAHEWELASLIVHAHHEGMGLEDYTEYNMDWLGENADPRTKGFPIYLFMEGVRGNDYNEYPEAYRKGLSGVVDLHRAGVRGSDVSQWGDCLGPTGIVTLAEESYSPQKSRELCEIAEEYDVNISGCDMLWFEEQGFTSDQVRAAAKDEYKEIRERFG